jgi:hypothetical protein
MKIMSEKNNGTVGEPGHKMRSIQKGASSGRLVNQHERAKKKGSRRSRTTPKCKQDTTSENHKIEVATVTTQMKCISIRLTDSFLSFRFMLMSVNKRSNRRIYILKQKRFP